MADLNNNGIDDAAEIETTRTVKNADGSSSTEKTWRKARLPDAMQKPLNESAPSVWWDTQTQELGNLARGAGNIVKGALGATGLPQAIQRGADAVGGALGEMSVTGQWPTSRNQAVPQAMQQPLTDMPIDTETQYVAPTAMTQTPRASQIGQRQFAIGGNTYSIDDRRIRNQMAAQNNTPSTNAVPSYMTALQGLGTTKIDPAQGRADSANYDEKQRQTRLAMGIGGTGPGNAAVGQNQMSEADIATMLANQGKYSGTKREQEAAKKARFDLARGRVAAQAATGAQTIENAQEIAIQAEKNKGLVGAAGATAQSEYQKKVDEQNIKNLGEGGWTNFVDPTTKNPVANTYVNKKGELRHFPVSGIQQQLDAELTAAPSGTQGDGSVRMRFPNGSVKMVPAGEVDKWKSAGGVSA